MSLESCARMCLDCYQTCTSVLTGYCLPRGGAHADAPHVTVMQDCAEICRISADFLLRRSPAHQLTCQVCAEICAHCADSCDRFNDDNLQRCADVCRACAEHCGHMSTTRTMHSRV